VITLAGETVNGGTGLATDPTTGTLWALLKLSGQDGRELVTIDPETGVATSIGNTGSRFAGIAFDASGNLFGVTGDGGLPPETLATLSKTDGSATFVCSLGLGGDGENIAFNPTDALLYHYSGNGVFEKITGFSGVADPIKLGLFAVDKAVPILYEIDPTDGQVIKTVIIKAEPSPSKGASALATNPGNTMFTVLVGDDKRDDNLNGRLATLNPTTGVATDIGILGEAINGLAFKDGTLFGITSQSNEGPAGENSLVSINQDTAEVTPLCELPGGGATHIAINPEDNFLYYGDDGELRKILDTSTCPKNPSGS